MEFLRRWSREWVVAHDPERDRPLDDEVRGGWLGFASASPAQITAAEQRLGCVLPPSLRAFLLLTDGWKNAGNFIYRLAGTAELEWLRDTNDEHWAAAYEDDVVRRSLRISLDGDASILFLDPQDVGTDGEWAAYRLASWSGEGPQRHDSFADLMYDLYAGFHALRKPPGDTRDKWDADVEQARRDALRGEVDRPAQVLAEAQRFGRERARLLRFQMCAMQGDWYTAPLAHLTLAGMSIVDDRIFDAELLPLMFAEGRLTHSRGQFTLNRLRSTSGGGAKIAEYEARRAEPGFRQPFGNPEFDEAVRAIVDDLTATVPDPAPPQTPPGRQMWIVHRSSSSEIPRSIPRAALDEAWPRLKAAISLWRPISDSHIAPVVLFTEPLLAEMITRPRGRELLQIPRGGQQLG